jgi:alkylation response protein AidB-like acyl-CoA dehydrogenase
MTATIDAITSDLGRAAGELLTRLLAANATVDRDRPDTAAWTAIARAGWFDVLLPAEHGGLGFDIAHLQGMLTAAGRHLFPGPVAEHAGVVPLLVDAAGDPARKRLLAATSGERMMAVVDNDAVRACNGGPALRNGRLDGGVDLVRFADWADDLIILIGRDEYDHSLMPMVAMVSVDAPGVTITPGESFDPVTSYAAVEFECVAPDHVFYEGQEAVTQVRRLRALMRLLTAAELAGVARALLDASVAYAGQREQFGRPIGSFQAVQHLLADAAAAVLVLEASVAAVFARAVGPAASLEPSSWELKALAARTGRMVAEIALQVHGGIAFTAEHDLHRAVHHALALQGRYGDERQLAGVIGAALLSRNLEPWR